VRLLLIHAERFSFEVRKPAIREHEPVDGRGAGEFENPLVVFVAVERNDIPHRNYVIARAVHEILDVFRRVSASRVILYPFVHITDDPAPPSDALSVFQELEQRIRSEQVAVFRAPFGWYKRFDLLCRGHPLAELSRTIRPESAKQVQRQIPSRFLVILPDGSELDPADFVANPLADREVRILVQREALRQPGPGGEPRFLRYCRKFGIEWEPASDLGHMRYEPDAYILFECITRYVDQLVEELGIPVFRIRGTNMFDLSIPAVRKHAELFGDRLYELHADARHLVLRYAACHQQFSAVKDWSISYRHLPFAVFEIADSYRFEQSGELLLAFRVRKLHMPDLHIFCRDLEEAQRLSFSVHQLIHREVERVGRRYVLYYTVTESFYAQHRNYLLQLIQRDQRPALVRIIPDGIYYWVLNAEYHIIDELDRPREIATFQIDIDNARRFGITYTTSEGSAAHPIILHIAFLGSVERWIYLLLDTAAQAEASNRKPSLPFWICPVQVRILPLRSDLTNAALEIAKQLLAAGFRADVDDRDLELGRKIRDAETRWIPLIVTYGPKEVETGVLAVRIRESGEVRKLSLQQLIQLCNDLQGPYPKLPHPHLPILVSQRPRYVHD